MSTSSSSDSYSAPTSIPSPQELSSLIIDPYTNEQIDRKFRSKPTSSAILRYYTFISHSITQLEDELERHQQEREILYDNLFASQTFKYKIRPIVEEYRHHRAMRRSIHHPYGRRTSPSTSSTDNSSTSEEFPPFRAPSLKKERTATPSPITTSSHEQILRAMSLEIHQHADITSFGSKERPIVVEDTNEENTLPPPCTHCGKAGHQWEDCDASLTFRGICETCLWERRHGDCPHFHFPSPAFVKQTKAAVAERNQRERQV